MFFAKKGVFSVLLIIYLLLLIPVAHARVCASPLQIRNAVQTRLQIAGLIQSTSPAALDNVIHEEILNYYKGDGYDTSLDSLRSQQVDSKELSALKNSFLKVIEKIEAIPGITSQQKEELLFSLINTLSDKSLSERKQILNDIATSSPMQIQSAINSVSLDTPQVVQQVEPSVLNRLVTKIVQAGRNLYEQVLGRQIPLVQGVPVSNLETLARQNSVPTTDESFLESDMEKGYLKPLRLDDCVQCVSIPNFNYRDYVVTSTGKVAKLPLVLSQSMETQMRDLRRGVYASEIKSEGIDAVTNRVMKEYGLTEQTPTNDEAENSAEAFEDLFYAGLAENGLHESIGLLSVVDRVFSGGNVPIAVIAAGSLGQANKVHSSIGDIMLEVTEKLLQDEVDRYNREHPDGPRAALSRYGRTKFMIIGMSNADVTAFVNANQNKIIGLVQKEIQRRVDDNSMDEEVLKLFNAARSGVLTNDRMWASTGIASFDQLGITYGGTTATKDTFNQLRAERDKLLKIGLLTDDQQDFADDLLEQMQEIEGQLENKVFEFINRLGDGLEQVQKENVPRKLFVGDFTTASQLKSNYKDQGRQFVHQHTVADVQNGVISFRNVDARVPRLNHDIGRLGGDFVNRIKNARTDADRKTAYKEFLDYVLLLRYRSRADPRYEPAVKNLPAYGKRVEAFLDRVRDNFNVQEYNNGVIYKEGDELVFLIFNAKTGQYEQHVTDVDEFNAFINTFNALELTDLQDSTYHTIIDIMFQELSKVEDENGLPVSAEARWQNARNRIGEVEVTLDRNSDIQRAYLDSYANWDNVRTDSTKQVQSSKSTVSIIDQASVDQIVVLKLKDFLFGETVKTSKEFIDRISALHTSLSGVEGGFISFKRALGQVLTSDQYQAITRGRTSLSTFEQWKADLERYAEQNLVQGRLKTGWITTIGLTGRWHDVAAPTNAKTIEGKVKDVLSEIGKQKTEGRKGKTEESASTESQIKGRTPIDDLTTIVRKVVKDDLRTKAQTAKSKLSENPSYDNVISAIKAYDAYMSQLDIQQDAAELLSWSTEFDKTVTENLARFLPGFEHREFDSDVDQAVASGARYFAENAILGNGQFYIATFEGFFSNIQDDIRKLIVEKWHELPGVDSLIQVAIMNEVLRQHNLPPMSPNDDLVMAGAGAFKVVYNVPGTNLVIKFSNPEAKSVSAMNLENRLAAELSHPGIARPLQSYEGELISYAIEPAATSDVSDVLPSPQQMFNPNTGQNVAPRVGLALELADILYALEYIHAKGKLHRDVKPQNILIMSDGSLLLTDLGLIVDKSEIARLAEGPVKVAGTLNYMDSAAHNGRPNEQSDKYALGVSMLNALIGRDVSNLKDVATNVGIREFVTTPLDYDLTKKALENILLGTVVIENGQFDAKSLETRVTYANANDEQTQELKQLLMDITLSLMFTEHAQQTGLTDASTIEDRIAQFEERHGSPNSFDDLTPQQAEVYQNAETGDFSGPVVSESAAVPVAIPAGEAGIGRGQMSLGDITEIVGEVTDELGESCSSG